MNKNNNYFHLERTKDFNTALKYIKALNSFHKHFIVIIVF